MPYKVFKINDEHCVYKVDENNNRVGESLGCHDSMEAAERQITAITIEEHKEFVSHFSFLTPSKLFDNLF